MGTRAYRVRAEYIVMLYALLLTFVNQVLAEPGSVQRLSEPHFDPAIYLDTILQSSQTEGRDKNTLEYIVCNKSKKPVVFHWIEPDFQCSLDRPLKSSDCAVLETTAQKSKREDVTKITYFQFGPTMAIPSFLPDLTLTQKLINHWDTIFGHGPLRIGVAPDPDVRYKLRDPAKERKVLSVEVIDKGDFIFYEIQWSEEVGAVFVKLATVVANDLDHVNEVMRKNGATPEIGAMVAADIAKRLKPEDRQQFAQHLKDGVFVSLHSKEKKRGRASFLVPVRGPTRPATQPILIVDHDERVVWLIAHATLALW